MRILLSILLFVVFIHPVNAVTTESKTGWIGHTAEELTKTMGKPNATTYGHNGNTIYIYNIQTSPSYRPSVTMNTTMIMSGHPVGFNVPRVNNNNSFARCIARFEVDKKGEIVSLHKEGNC